MAEEIPKQTTPEQETTAPTGKKKKEKGKRGPDCHSSLHESKIRFFC